MPQYPGPCYLRDIADAAATADTAEAAAEAAAAAAAEEAAGGGGWLLADAEAAAAGVAAGAIDIARSPRQGLIRPTTSCFPAPRTCIRGLARA
jgi:hypothetical protein